MLRQWMEVALKGLPESLQEAKYKGLYHDDNTCTCTCMYMYVHVHVCSNTIVLNQPDSQTRWVFGFVVNDLWFIITCMV